MNAILVAGAALVGLPILLHLIMKQEPKRLSFPAFRFLTQRLKTNQRKLRLRHFILLALRMLLIALFCLALYQPTLKSDRLNIRGEQPVAAVVVIDTSPSTGYTVNDKTRLDEERRRALELLEELPDKSPVAVVTTDDPAAGYWVDVAEARRQIEALDKPRGGTQPVTEALARAYQLLAKVEGRDADDGDQLPKLVAVFTDRAAASWDSGRAEDLKKLREKIPDPKPVHAVADVGADKPVNVGILSAEMRPQVIAANQPAVVNVTVAAAGPPELPPAEVTVVARLVGTGVSDRRQAVVPYGGRPQLVVFRFDNLKPGLHQVEFSLAAPDKLAADNTRFLTFKVGEARRVLTIADDPESALYWQGGLLAAKEPFSTLVVKPEDVKLDGDGRTVVVYADPARPDAKPAEFNIREFEAVCLLSVADPSKKYNGLDSLWQLLRPYVEGGGKLVVIPGENASPEGYAAGGNLMPGVLKDVVSTAALDPPPPPQTAPGWPDPRDGRAGVKWFIDDDRVLQHPMLRPFQEWKAKGNVDAVTKPRLTWKYWGVEKDPAATVVVKYNNAEKDEARHPAVLERGVADPMEPTRVKGRVVLLTTKMDPEEVGLNEGKNWHDYWKFESTWFSVFPWLVVRYVAGDTADANFNFPVGQSVTVPLPKGGVPRGARVAIDHPSIAAGDALVEVGDRQTELRVGPPRANFPGNYRLFVRAAGWQDGFSLNTPAEEGVLDKVAAETVEELTGPGSVLPLDKDLRLRDVMTAIIGAPLDLFPWLLIAVLLLLALEGLVANRFYRKVR